MRGRNPHLKDGNLLAPTLTRGGKGSALCFAQAEKTVVPAQWLVRSNRKIVLPAPAERNRNKTESDLGPLFFRCNAFPLEADFFERGYVVSSFTS
jgi:hypothetical protein